MALLLTYPIGVLAVHEPAHRFVRHWLGPAELRDGLLLALLLGTA